MRDHYEFRIDSRRYLNADGKVLTPLPAWAQDEDRLLSAYRTMALIRAFDTKAIALQRTGQLGTYPSVLGHEAIGTAIGQILQPEDVLVPYYRDQAAQVLRGVSLVELLLYWGGDERGSAYENCPHDLPICVPIATQCSHAAGIAAAMRIRGESQVVLCSLGDGATSKGDFLESLNVAGAWHLPLVFVVANNQWAISTPRHAQTASATIAQKAIGAGIPGRVVDGNDYFAIADAVEEAVQRARDGKGATLIEAQTYRLGDHTTADDATRYRSADELRTAWEHEPIRRLQGWLHAQGLWDAQKEQVLQADCKATLEQAVADYLAIPPQPATSMFDHLFATLPASLQPQYDAVRARQLDAGEVRHA